jgi:hypothetical protein
MFLTNESKFTTYAKGLYNVLLGFTFLGVIVSLSITFSEITTVVECKL